MCNAVIESIDSHDKDSDTQSHTHECVQISHIIAEQYQDDNFNSLSGGKVIRIAVHPDSRRMGYGSATMEILKNYYSGQIERSVLYEGKVDKRKKIRDSLGVNLEIQIPAPQPLTKTNLPPLLLSMKERPAERLDYLGVSFGLSKKPYNFWHRNGYRPVYLRQEPNSNTGEHSIIMLHALQNSLNPNDVKWFTHIEKNFKIRFIALLGGTYRSYHPILALSIIGLQTNSYRNKYDHALSTEAQTNSLYPNVYSNNDLKRLHLYSNNLADYHLILDLLPSIAQFFFLGRFPTRLSFVQAAILLSIGLQHKPLAIVEEAIDLPTNQILALLNHTICKLVNHLIK